MIDVGTMELCLAAGSQDLYGDQRLKTLAALELGGMDPIHTRAGLHKRLHNLGYCGPAPSSQYEGLEAAIAIFQKDHGMKATGICDAATRNKLRQKHGS